MSATVETRPSMSPPSYNKAGGLGGSSAGAAAAPAVPSKAVAATNGKREEYEKRNRRKSSYHLVASKNKLPSDPDDVENDPLYEYLLKCPAESVSRNDVDVRDIKSRLVMELAKSEGDVDAPEFRAVLAELVRAKDPTAAFDARRRPSKSARGTGLEGMWINLSKPKYPNCLGKNEQGDLLYTLGRMSFNTFSPTDLVCSISGTFNPVHVIKDPLKALGRSGIPDSLLEEILDADDLGHTVVRSYQIVTAFCIEPPNPKDDETDPAAGEDTAAAAVDPNRSVRRRIEGLLTTDGYVIPSPYQPNRLSIWFTGGSMEVQKTVEGSSELREWMEVFADSIRPPTHTTSSSSSNNPHGSCSDSVSSAQSTTSSSSPTFSKSRSVLPTTPTKQPIPLHQAGFKDVILGREGGFRDRHFGSRSPRSSTSGGTGMRRRSSSTSSLNEATPAGPVAAPPPPVPTLPTPVVMEPDGRMSYRLPNPIGGHDTAYVDVLYLDETLRIVQANTGSLHVMARVPYFADE